MAANVYKEIEREVTVLRPRGLAKLLAACILSCGVAVTIALRLAEASDPREEPEISIGALQLYERLMWNRLSATGGY